MEIKRHRRRRWREAALLTDADFLLLNLSEIPSDPHHVERRRSE